MSETTGFIDFHYNGETYQTWYRVFGDLHTEKRPLVVLHGGPGIDHTYVLPHINLFYSLGVPVVFYDQVGIGRSTHLKDKGSEFWNIDLFIDELENVLAYFNISNDYDLLGHSWGGFLAATFAGARPSASLKHLILANTGASMKLWSVGTNKLLDRLPQDVRDMLKKHELDGTTDSKEYQEGMQIFYNRHVCRLQPWPEQLLASFGAMSEDPTVYSTMIGPSEFNCVGTLKNWTCEADLPRIQAATLVLNAPEDEAQDVANYPFLLHIPRVKWVQFLKSTHLPFFEEPERYFSVVGEFLQSI